MNITLSNVIEIHDDTSFIRSHVINELTFLNPKYLEAKNAGRRTYGIDKYIMSFSISPKGSYLLPRGYKDRLIYLLEKNNAEYTIDDKRSISYVDYGDHLFVARQYQYDALVEMAKHTDGILSSPAGSGKTIMGISLIVMSRQKTLWITHTNQLADQFADVAKKRIYGLTENDIGFIRDGEWYIGDKLTVGLVQTMSKNKDNLAEIKDDFGLVVVDECHHCPATTFTEVVTQLNPYLLYGVTATPDRQDGLWKVAEHTLGPIRYEVPRHEVNAANGIITPTVKAVLLNTTNINQRTYHTIIQSLVNNSTRTSIIINDVVNEYKNGNVCIVITDRKNHAEKLFNRLKQLKIPVGITTGNYSKKEIRKTLNSLYNHKIDVLVCTSHLLGEGFDFAPLNRLFISLPFRNPFKCEQLVGRIQRPAPNKTDAIIYDYVDVTCGLTKNQYKNYSGKPCRYNVYKKLGCRVEETRLS